MREEQDVDIGFTVYLHPKGMKVYWIKNQINELDRAHAEQLASLVHKTAEQYFELMRTNCAGSFYSLFEEFKTNPPSIKCRQLHYLNQNRFYQYSEKRLHEKSNKPPRKLENTADRQASSWSPSRNIYEELRLAMESILNFISQADTIFISRPMPMSLFIHLYHQR